VRNRGNACRVVLPLYGDIPCETREKFKFVTYFYVPLAWRSQYCGVFEYTHGGVKYYFLDNEYYFKRKGLYGFFDDGERFAFFSRALLEMLSHIDFEPEIIHCNDWQTALVPVYLDAIYRKDEKLQHVKTVFTIHNIQYQGQFDLNVVKDILGLPEGTFGIVEYCGDANYMKGAIEQCDALTTVSPTYASELLDPWYAHKLDKLLALKSYKLRGILNGIDIKLHDPATDPRIAENYTPSDISGKALCKKALQQATGLDEDPGAMIIGMVSRLVGHKGMDLVQFAFSHMMKMHIQFVLLGSGDTQYENFFRGAADACPGRVWAHIGFDDALSAIIYSGADVLLMPSRSEPCGLSQMIAMRYGTPPIVRATGGLNDSVRDFGGENGNGYNFLTYNADDMLGAVSRARGDFSNPDIWESHVQAAMKNDFSWGRSAAEYISLYRQLLGR